MMRFIAKTFLVFIFIFSHANAQEYKGAHYITMLPILSDLQNKENKEIEILVEDILSKDKVIQYKKHDGLKQTLEKYNEQLDKVLHDPKILKVVANKLLVGSLIRTDVRKFLLGYKVNMEIVSPDGDVLLKRNKVIYKNSPQLVSNIIVFWVQQFLKEIPFDAIVVDVKDNEVLVDYPTKKDQLFYNMQFVIIRKAKFSLISENIKEGDFREVAYGVVIEIRDDFFLGKIIEQKKDIKLQEGDKIVFKVFDEVIAAKNPNYKYRRHDVGDYRDNGRVAVFGSLVKLTGDGGSEADLTGATAEIDFYLPNNTVLLFDLTRRSGGQSSSSSLNDNSYRGMFGYTFHPKKNQWISYADMYVGYGRDTLAAGSLGVKGIKSDISFEGPLGGIRFEHPIYKNLSALTQFELSLLSKFKEKVKVLGDAERAYSYSLSLGMRYLVPNTGFSFEGMFRHKKHNAKIENSETEVILSSSQVMLGCSYYY